MADPDLELRRGPGFFLLTLPSFLPSVITSFFTQNKGERGPPRPLQEPRSATAQRQEQKLLFGMMPVTCEHLVLFWVYNSNEKSA